MVLRNEFEERLFSELYEEQREYNDRKEKRRKRRSLEEEMNSSDMKRDDISDVLEYYDGDDKYKEAREDFSSDDMERIKSRVEKFRSESPYDGKAIADLAATGGMSGALLGTRIHVVTHPGSKLINKGTAIGGAIGAASGAALGVGIPYAVKKAAVKINDKMLEDIKDPNSEASKSLARSNARERDQIKVAKGEMTPQEFAEKWNK